MSIRLYVGNLPKEVEREELEAVFSDFNDLLSVKVITDKKTGKCRGFGFVTVKTDEQADAIIEKLNGQEFKDTTLKIEKALPRSKGKESNGSPSASGGGRRKGGNNNKSRRSDSSSSSQSTQPDPRWAGELEKLKQMLATQTANS
ncbi:MAG: RNA recognition motif domain-containing protein [Thainema sp.]